MTAAHRDHWDEPTVELSLGNRLPPMNDGPAWAALFRARREAQERGQEALKDFHR